MRQIIIIPLEFSRATNVKLGTPPILHLGEGGGPSSGLTLAQRRALKF